MKKLMVLAGLAVGLSQAVFADNTGNNAIFNGTCDEDSLCAQVTFINFPDDKLQLSSIDLYQKEAIYDKTTDLTPEWRIDKRAVVFDEEIPSNRISYIDEAGKSSVDVEHNVTYQITKGYVFRINAINDVPVSDCTIQHDSIMDTTGGVKDHITITRIDDQHYTCSVSQG